MRGFRLACNHPDIVEKGPSEINFNLTSKIFRNGIAIIGFSILEHFIRERTGEIFLAFKNIKVPFNDLPDKIQDNAIRGAVIGIRSIIRYPETSLRDIQEEVLIISSSLSTKYQISRYATGWEKPNLSSKDISQILNSFKIQKGWDCINKISNRLNLTIPSAKSSFDNAAYRRNSAAHNINANINPNDLQSFIREAYAIAISFDIMVSTAYQKLYQRDTTYLANDGHVKDNDVKFRIVKYRNGGWLETRENANRVTRREVHKQMLISDAKRRANKNNEIFVSFNIKGYPTEWTIPCRGI